MKRHQQVHAVTLSKLDNNNNNKSDSMCSIHHQRLLSFRSNNKMTTYHKSPIEKLKENVESLKKKVQTNLVIKQYSHYVKKDIASQLLIKQQEIEIRELKSKLSENIVNSLEIKQTVDINYQEKIRELESKLIEQNIEYNKRLVLLQNALKEKEKVIFEKQKLYKSLKEKHKQHLLQLNAIHQDRINLLSAQHKRELNQKRTSREPVNDDSVNEIIEKALIEFEQEQHDIKPDEIRQTVNISRGLIHNRLQTNQD